MQDPCTCAAVYCSELHAQAAHIAGAAPREFAVWRVLEVQHGTAYTAGDGPGAAVPMKALQAFVDMYGSKHNVQDTLGVAQASSPSSSSSSQATWVMCEAGEAQDTVPAARDGFAAGTSDTENPDSALAASDVPWQTLQMLLERRPQAAVPVVAVGQCRALAAQDMSGELQPTVIQRRPVGPQDVRVQVTHCSLCHTDCHQLTGEWQNSIYPMVPGHEVVGIVTAVGSEVGNVRVGDPVGVGFMVRSCQSCAACQDDKEQFCGRRVYSYNNRDWDRSVTQGGLSEYMVVDHRFVVHIRGLPLPNAAPLLCAGITTYSAMQHFKLAQPDKHVAVLGLGGLGHLAVRLLVALGARVTVLSSSAGKKEHAMAMGAADFVVTGNAKQLRGLYGQLHGIIDTVAAPHDQAALLPLLRYDGILVLLGAPDGTLTLRPFDLLPRRLSVAGSIIGGLRETQDLLDFCAQHSIHADVETFNASQVNEALKALNSNTLRSSRAVIDVLTL